MPELIEVEAYRALAERCLGRRIASVHCPDPWYLKGGLAGPNLAEWVIKRSITAATRKGKLLMLSISGGGPVLGLRFGMTGKLLVDGESAIGGLLYSTRRDTPEFVRFGLGFIDGGGLMISDPRRLGGVEVDPDPDLLGPDAASLTPGQLRSALAGSNAALKSRLMDQGRVAGLGNLLTDEILWRCRLHPGRPAGSLTSPEAAALQRTIRSTVKDLTKRGGSHTGDLQGARIRGGVCPRCGSPLGRAAVGGRTTFWCTIEQAATN
jgi:formamidopyrimidine-DNA glycosylase